MADERLCRSVDAMTRAMYGLCLAVDAATVGAAEAVRAVGDALESCKGALRELQEAAAAYRVPVVPGDVETDADERREQARSVTWAGGGL